MTPRTPIFLPTLGNSDAFLVNSDASIFSMSAESESVNPSLSALDRAPFLHLDSYILSPTVMLSLALSCTTCTICQNVTKASGPCLRMDSSQAFYSIGASASLPLASCAASSAPQSFAPSSSPLSSASTMPMQFPVWNIPPDTCRTGLLSFHLSLRSDALMWEAHVKKPCPPFSHSCNSLSVLQCLSPPVVLGCLLSVFCW
jgi:hypothetical protein